MAGIKWETKQRSEAIRGGSFHFDREKPLTRKYRITEAAANTLENEFNERCEALLDTDAPWACLLPWVFTAYFGAFASRVVLRAKASVYRLLAVLHRKFPFRFFLLLFDPVKYAQEFLRLERCELDEFSDWFISKFPTKELLCSPEALLILLVIAKCAKLDIVHEELFNGRIRRHVVAASHQTHRQGIGNAVCDLHLVALRLLTTKPRL